MRLTFYELRKRIGKREGSRLTLQEVADDTGIKLTTIWNMENGLVGTKKNRETLDKYLRERLHNLHK